MGGAPVRCVGPRTVGGGWSRQGKRISRCHRQTVVIPEAPQGLSGTQVTGPKPCSRPWVPD